MTTQFKYYLDWLRDAHAMEQQAEKILSDVTERLENHPSLKVRVQQYIKETQDHQQSLKNIISSYGESTSTLKDLVGKMSAVFVRMKELLASDEVVKGAIEGYVFVQFEAVCYKILLSAANHIGAIQDKIIFEEVLAQKEMMAKDFFEHIPQITQQFLVRAE